MSNESPQDVFFDNVTVQHHRGPLLEESHYYAFGLAMAGLTAKAAGKAENKYKFNGNEIQHQEFSNGDGLETMDFNARMYDAQIGRFWQVDPLSNQMRNWSPYAFSFDNPINYADPEGLSGQKDTAGKLNLKLPVKKEPKAQPKPQPQQPDPPQEKPAPQPEQPQPTQPQPSQPQPSPQQVQPDPQDDTPQQPDPGPPPPPDLSKLPPPPELQKASEEDIKKGMEEWEKVATTMSVSEIVEVGLDKAGKAAKAAGNASTEAQIATQLKETGELAETTAKVFKVVGKVAGIATAAISIKKAWDDPTVGHIAKAVGQTVLIFVKTNPIVTTILVIADVTGFTDWLFDKF